VTLVLIATSLIYSAWMNFQVDARAQCQADLNGQFLEVLENNAAVASADRDNLAETIAALGDADSAAESRTILDEYETRRGAIDADREEYPPLPRDVCA